MIYGVVFTIIIVINIIGNTYYNKREDRDNPEIHQSERLMLPYGYGVMSSISTTASAPTFNNFQI